VDPKDWNFLIKLAEAHSKKGDYLSSIRSYVSALSLIEKANNVPLFNRVKVLLARSLYQHGERDTAVQIFTTILQSDEDNVEAWFGYAIALRDHSKYGDALRVLLKALILKSESKEVKEQIADVLSGPGGVEAMKVLFEELENSGNKNTGSPSVASAYAFLATFIKDFGALEQSAKLFHKALSLKPRYCSYCLTFVHVLEVMVQYKEAFIEIKKFCSNNLELSIGNIVKCKQVLDIIDKIGNLYQHKENLWQNESVQSSSPSNFPVKPQEKTVVNPKLQVYSPDELDLLALLCTAVKILYVVGTLDLIPPFVELIEPAREGRELHLTTIRNEHAYYCCIAQLMLYHNLPLINYRPLYVAGDSHSMSPAWKTITVKGEKRLLYPKLVTGLKIWHLRPESKFFPKANFYNVIETIPQGSEVIFLFGEIDCREGLLKAVEKFKYKDLDEAMLFTIDIYIKVLTDLLGKYSFKAYIHPIIPVLNETRAIVKLFNKHLQTKISTVPNLHYLNFFEDLLVNDQTRLNPEYELDGTHMHPKYVTLIEKSLNTLNE